MTNLPRRPSSRSIVRDLDLSGKHFFVTGCNSGLGKATTIALYEAGARVTMACRSTERMVVARDEIVSESDAGSLEMLQLTLGDHQATTDSVIAFLENDSARTLQTEANEAERSLPLPEDVDESRFIDVLILNAGVLPFEKSFSASGDELSMGVNFIGSFALALLLLPFVRDRIVIVAASAEEMTRVDPEALRTDPDWTTRRFNGMHAYAQSRFCLMACSRELHRRLSPSGPSIFCLHPGMSMTNIGREQRCLMCLIYCVARSCLKNASQGAATSLVAALHPIESLCRVEGSEDKDGEGSVWGFLQDCDVVSEEEFLRRSGGSIMQNEELIGEVWRMFEQRSGIEWSDVSQKIGLQEDQQ